MSQAQHDHSLAAKVAATVSRLRLIASDFADAEPQVRRTHLSDEVERAVASILPDQKQAFLQALEEKFPAWDGQVKLSSDDAPRSAADQKELNDVGFLVRRLCELSRNLDPQAKSAIIEQLQSAGILPENVALPWSEQSLQALRAKLQLGEQRKINPERLLELTLQLIDFSASLHQLVGTAWRTIAPTADVKYRQGSFTHTMGRFVAEDPAVNKPQLSNDIEKLRQLVASLVAAIGDVGRQFARGYIARFAPSEIKTAATSEPGVFVTLEAKCWRKYLEVWDTLDEAGIEAEIRDTVAKYAEQLLKGLAR